VARQVRCAQLSTLRASTLIAGLKIDVLTGSVARPAGSVLPVFQLFRVSRSRRYSSTVRVGSVCCEGTEVTVAPWIGSSVCTRVIRNVTYCLDGYIASQPARHPQEIRISTRVLILIPLISLVLSLPEGDQA
jgi:hypothetical protein